MRVRALRGNVYPVIQHALANIRVYEMTSRERRVLLYSSILHKLSQLAGSKDSIDFSTSYRMWKFICMTLPTMDRLGDFCTIQELTVSSTAPK